MCSGRNWIHGTTKHLRLALQRTYRIPAQMNNIALLEFTAGLYRRRYKTRYQTRSRRILWHCTMFWIYVHGIYNSLGLIE